MEGPLDERKASSDSSSYPVKAKNGASYDGAAPVWVYASPPHHTGPHKP